MNKNNVLQHLLLGVFLMIFSTASVAQNTILRANGAMNDGDSHWNNDTDTVKTENVPIGLYVWKINPRFGDIIKAEPDTLPHLFQNEAFTGGTTGHYNYTGNLGSPRNSRILSDNLERTFSPQFIFAKPYDYFLTPISDLLFTNTKSPITNITYHECGNKQNGEDRIRALFATNAGNASAPDSNSTTSMVAATTKASRPHISTARCSPPTFQTPIICTRHTAPITSKIPRTEVLKATTTSHAPKRFQRNTEPPTCQHGCQNHGTR